MTVNGRDYYELAGLLVRARTNADNEQQ